jgi:hypothetical protein
LNQKYARKNPEYRQNARKEKIIENKRSDITGGGAREQQECLS